MTTSAETNPAVPAAEEELFFTLWTVFKRIPGNPVPDTQTVPELEQLLSDLPDVTVRGIYDVSALRADADVMFWLHGPRAEALQAAVRQIRRTQMFSGTEIAWSSMGVHRAAEFAKDHSPAFTRGVDPEAWVCVYPFVRSYEWYLLPAEERARMLRGHGMMGVDYRQVLTNTVPSFALGDWEWLLALEAPQLVDLVDLMRHLRGADARNHVREEVPFYTGRRITPQETLEVLR